MTHLCEILPFRRIQKQIPAPARSPNRDAHTKLCLAEKLADSVSGDVQAGLCNAAEGVATNRLGGLVDGRTLTWAVKLCLTLIELRRDAADEALKQSLTQWLHGGQGNDQ